MMQPDLVNGRFATCLNEDFTRQATLHLVDLKSQPDIKKNKTKKTVQSEIMWALKHSVVRSVTGSESSERERENRGWRGPVFPRRERSQILMTFKRQVCISFWSVTSCGEVYVPSGWISSGHAGARSCNVRWLGGWMVFWLHVGKLSPDEFQPRRRARSSLSGVAQLIPVRKLIFCFPF